LNSTRYKKIVITLYKLFKDDIKGCQQILKYPTDRYST